MFLYGKEDRRRELLEQPFPDTWLAYLHENVFLYRLLSEEEQADLRDALRILIAEKYWEGCSGLLITDEIQVTIAAQACVLVLGFDDYYFDDLQSVLVYPGGYLGLDPSRDTDRADHRLGEAHHKGPVVLSWWHARWDGRRLGRRNLVLHEFAHKLAQVSDRRSETPPIEDQIFLRRWEKIMAAEYERLREDTKRARPTLLDPYGATNRAEFFAVATECFFMQPVPFRERHRKLYRLLAEWYRQDPAARRPLNEEELKLGSAAEAEYIEHSIRERSAAIRLYPDDADAYRGRGQLYEQQGDLDKALADYSTVIRLDPDNPESYCARGELYAAKGHDPEALADFDQALHLSADWASGPYRQRGDLYARRGAWKLAIADYSRAIRAESDDAETYLARAVAYAAQGDEHKALRDRAKAKQLAARMCR